MCNEPKTTSDSLFGVINCPVSLVRGYITKVKIGVLTPKCVNVGKTQNSSIFSIPTLKMWAIDFQNEELLQKQQQFNSITILPYYLYPLS